MPAPPVSRRPWPRRLAASLAWKWRQLREFLDRVLTLWGPQWRIHLRWPLRKPWQRSELTLASMGGGLGDELMCVPVFREIKARRPQVRLTFASRYPEIFRTNPDLDAVVPLGSDRIGMTVLSYSAVLPPPRPLIALVGECAGLKMATLHARQPPPPPSPGVQRLLQDIPRPFLVVQPLSSHWTPNKNWPRAKWIELLRMLAQECEVVEVGQESAFAECNFGPRYHVLTGQTNVAEFAWIVSQGAAFLGPVSSGMHLSAVYGIPAVIIFGGYEHPHGFTYPNVTAFAADVPCAPCWLTTGCPFGQACLHAIATAVREALAGKKREAGLQTVMVPGPPQLFSVSEAPSRVLDVLAGAVRRTGAAGLGRHLARPLFSGCGCILALHRIIPEEQRSALPQNRALEITPEDLRAVLKWIRECGLEAIPMEAVPDRLRRPRGAKFVAITADDGYRDNVEIAAPILRAAGVPWTLNVASGLIDGTSQPWWYLLERVVQRAPSLSFEWKGRGYTFPGGGESVFLALAALVRAQGMETRDSLIAVLCAAAGLTCEELSHEFMASWEQIAAAAADPLLSLGCHTVGHYTLSKLSEAETRREMDEARRRIEAVTGRPVTHLAYPYGDRGAVGEREFRLAAEAGYLTASTTRLGNLFPAHAGHLHALPRLTLSGNFPAGERLRQLDAGLIPALANRLRRVVTI